MNFKIKKQKGIRGLRYLLIPFALLSLSLSAKQLNKGSNEIQQVSDLSIKQEISMENLFQLITKKTDYRFFYSNGLKDLNKKVVLNVTNAKVEQILKIAFRNLKIEYRIEGNKIMLRNKIVKKANVKRPLNKPPKLRGIVKDDTGVRPKCPINTKPYKHK